MYIYIYCSFLSYLYLIDQFNYTSMLVGGAVRSAAAARRQHGVSHVRKTWCLVFERCSCSKDMFVFDIHARIRHY